MIDLKKGTIKINDDLTIHPQYTFSEFKKTKFYTNQDGVKIIYLDEKQVIDNKKFIVELFFRSNNIYMVSLICCENEYTEKYEKERKNLHDKLLETLGIKEKKEFNWGTVSSNYDIRSNISSIDIIWK